MIPTRYHLRFVYFLFTSLLFSHFLFESVLFPTDVKYYECLDTGPKQYHTSQACNTNRVPHVSTSVSVDINIKALAETEKHPCMHGSRIYTVLLWYADVNNHYVCRDIYKRAYVDSRHIYLALRSKRIVKTSRLLYPRSTKSPCHIFVIICYLKNLWFMPKYTFQWSNKYLP